MKKLSVLMPVYNEERTLEEIVLKVRKAKLPGSLTKELIIVDDDSTDRTKKILQAMEIKYRGSKFLKVYYQEKNQGKGSAIRRAMEAATGDYAVIQDADLEYDPKDYGKLLAPILENKADVVYGSRFDGAPRRVLFFWHFVGNTFLTLLSNMLTDLNLTDMETCYKAFRMEVLKKMNLKSNRFGIEPEVTAKVAKLKCRVYEVPVSYYGRDYSEGKKISWKDGVSAIWTILRYNLFD